MSKDEIVPTPEEKAELKEYKKENKLSLNAVKPILSLLSKEDGKNYLEMAEPICNAIMTYGCRKEILILEAVKSLAPISERFFKLLHDTVQISKDTNYKKFEKIVEIVSNTNDDSYENRLFLVKMYLDEEHERRKDMLITTAKEIILPVLQTAAMAGLTAFLGSKTLDTYGDVKKEKINANASVQKTKLLTDTYKSTTISKHETSIQRDSMKYQYKLDRNEQKYQYKLDRNEQKYNEKG